MIIVEEYSGEAYKLLSVLKCPEDKEDGDCEKTISCWDCIASASGLDFKIAAIKESHMGTSGCETETI